MHTLLRFMNNSAFQIYTLCKFICDEDKEQKINENLSILGKTVVLWKAGQMQKFLENSSKLANVSLTASLNNKVHSSKSQDELLAASSVSIMQLSFFQPN